MGDIYDSLGTLEKVTYTDGGISCPPWVCHLDRNRTEQKHLLRARAAFVPNLRQGSKTPTNSTTNLVQYRPAAAITISSPEDRRLFARTAATK